MAKENLTEEQKAAKAAEEEAKKAAKAEESPNQKLAKEIFAQYEQYDAVWITADGLGWATEGLAISHGMTYEKFERDK